jgi:signal transduction histidine kinase/ActR/RegA family two-component response regulator
VRGLVTAAAALPVAMGLAVMIGWIFDIQGLRVQWSLGVAMKANTAACLLLSGISLLLLLPPDASPWRRRVGLAGAAIVCAFGALTLSEHLVGWNLGIDQLLIHEPPGELATTSPGRMEPPASTSFVLIGLALLLLDWRTRRNRSPSQGMVVAVAVIALLPVLGYVTNAKNLFDVANLTGIAFHTSLSLSALALGIFLARPDARPALLLVAPDAGGQLARRMLPASVLLPIVVGWLRMLGEQQGLYGHEYSRAFALLTLILLFSTIVWFTAARLSRLARAHDIVEQSSRSVQAQARKLASENAEMLSILDSFLEHAPVGFALLDRQHRYVRVNEFLAGISARPKEDHIGRDMRDVLPGDARPAEAAVDGVFAKGHPVTGVEVADADRTWLYAFFPVREQGGRIGLVGAVVVEITERKRLEAQRAKLLHDEREARVEAERTARLKDEFLATLSHELRTPLNAILGWASIIKSGKTRADDLPRAVDTIVRSARAQAQLIDDLLDVSRIISGKMRLEVRAVDLGVVVQAAIASVTPAAEAKAIRIEQHLDPRARSVKGDPARLQQIAWNLLSNAVKFTPRGGHIDVRLERADGNAEIAVADTGIGIKPEFLPHVFERFRQADASTTRRHGGLGLGLAIVHELAEMHGGSVRVASSGENLGTTFTVSLPLAPAKDGVPSTGPQPSDLAGQPAIASDPLAERASLAGLHVLVVDDEADARELMRRLLSEGEATIEAVASCDEALAALERSRPHVLVSDIGMPGKDGYDLIQAVRERFDERALPAIAMTAYAQAEDRRRALHSGYQAHLAKPVDAKLLRAAVAYLAGRGAAADPRRDLSAS